MKRINIIFTFLLFCLSSTLWSLGSNTVYESMSPKDYSAYPEITRTINYFSIHSTLLRDSFSSGHLFYSDEAKVYSKAFYAKDSIALPGLDDVTTSYPLFSKDYQTLYLKVSHLPDRFHVVALTSSGKAHYLFTYLGAFNFFDISSDGREIVFDTVDRGLYQVYQYNLVSGHSEMVTNPIIGGAFPAFSPDARAIAYISNRKIRIKNINSGEENVLADDGLLKELPRWSPDGQWLIYQAITSTTTSYDIYKVNIATGKVIQLTNNPGFDINPSFDRTGKKIIYVSTPLQDKGNQTIHVMDADGKNISEDRSTPSNVSYPAF